MADEDLHSPFHTQLSCILDGSRRHGVFCADNLTVLPLLPEACVDLVYLDPPFNTGRRQQRTQRRTRRVESGGDRTGFQGRRYLTDVVGHSAYDDCFADYASFMEPRLRHAHRVLKPSGSLYLHLDYREAHRCKLLLDAIFGEANFLNEIIWAYDYGGRPRDRWPHKHDTIFLYAKHAGKHVFNREEVERIPYMAPGLVSAEKARRGKLPTDVWWHTIVSPTGKEKLGYATQKPLGILRRMVQASAPTDGLVLDFFAGSGTAGQAALETGRRFLLVDHHSAAFEVMQRRFRDIDGVHFERAKV